MESGNSQEEGIFRSQLHGIKRTLLQADGVQKEHSRGIGYINERIKVYGLFLYYVLGIPLLASVLSFDSALVFVISALVPFLILGIVKYFRLRKLLKLRAEHVANMREK